MAWKFVGANFDQMHQNTNLRWVSEHPDAELVGVCDEEPSTSTGSLDRAVEELDVPGERVFSDLDDCIEATEPDVVLGAPRNSMHASFTERVAAHDVHLAIEKPLAMSLADADRMLSAVDDDQLFVVNWPVAWDPVTHTLKRLVSEGAIGDPIEIQYYGGNAAAPPVGSWFYDPAAGGGSLLDYLGYGATFSTWFRGGTLPETVNTETYVPEDLEVDVQSASTCRFADGLSVLQTSWRTFTHPWEYQPQPPKGYEIVGTEGTLSTRERGAEIRIQTEEDPAGHAVEPDELDPEYENLIYYLIHCLEQGENPEGPPDPAFCREAQRIVETARQSAQRGGGPLELVE